MTSINFVDLLPASLSCLLVSSWLDLASIGQLDTAFCNHSLRPSFIGILSSVECVNGDPWKCVLNNGTLVKVFEWLLLRGMKMSTVRLDIDSSLGNFFDMFAVHFHESALRSAVREVISQHKHNSGQFLEYMKHNKTKLSHFNHIESEFHGPVVTFINQNCENVRNLSLSRWDKEKQKDFRLIGRVCKRLTSFACDTGCSNHSIAMIIANNPHLEELRLRCGTPWDTHIARYNLPRLRLLYLHLRPGYAECIRDAILLSDKLQQLCLQANNLFVATLDLMFIVEHCPHLKSLGLIGIIIYDTELTTIADKCRQIQHLDISQNKVVTDNGILSIAQSLTDLRSINLQQCVHLTDQALEHLSVHRAGSLEEMCLGGNGEGITQGGVEAVQQACQSECARVRSLTGEHRHFSLRWYELCRKQAQFPYGSHLMTTHLRVATDIAPRKLEMIASEFPNVYALHLSPNSHALQLDARMLLHLHTLVQHCPRLKTVYLSPFMYTQEGKRALLALYPNLLFMTDDVNFYYDALAKSIE